MKVGIISSMAAAPWGGSEELWVALGKQALSDGHQVSVSVFDWGKLPSKISELKDRGALVHLRSRISYSDIKGKLKGKLVKFFVAERQLHSFLKDQRPDIIFLSLGAFCDLEIDSLKRFLLKVNIPFFIVVHSNNESYSVENSKVKDVREVCKKAQKVLFVSDRVKQQSERQIAYDFKNSSIIINPVNITESGILPYKESEIMQMACVGTIQVGVKGQAMLLQILGSQKWKDRKWILNIYGSGPDEELLKQLINFYDLKEKVFMKGYASDIRNEIWGKNHILVMPSFIEGMPISLVEAMLCGRTAVVTDVGGNREMIQDNVSGFIAEGATPFSFDKSLEIAWQNRPEWSNMGKIAFEKAMSIYKVDPIKSLFNSLKE